MWSECVVGVANSGQYVVGVANRKWACTSSEQIPFLLMMSFIYGTDNDQFSWVKWRTGVILQYGNLSILSIEELTEGMFPKAKDKPIMVFAEEQWQKHDSASKIFGINIETSDLYPLLKFPEARKKYKRVRSGIGKPPRARNKPDIFVDEDEKEGVGPLGKVPNRMVSIDQIDSEFEKLRIRLDMSRATGQGEGQMGVVNEMPNGRVSPGPMRGRNSQHHRNHDKQVHDAVVLWWCC